MSKNVSKKKTVEEKYQKLSQREHVLQRPGMYIGSVKKQIEELWCFKDGKMQKAMIEFSPGFMKIFDEILTNALDHSARDSTLNSIKVDFNKQTGEISVWNNGSGIPVVEHSEHKMYIPELIFGHLLSGSNYDDSEARTGAGTNGLGSKCTNIYSKKFVIETVDSENNKKFVQEYFDNMSKRNPPKITKSSVKSYTKITFIPDYPRFDMKCLEEDTICLLNKRVYDCIANTGNHVSVYLNGEKLKGKGLNDYIKYFVEDEKIIYDSFTQGEYIWEYAVVPSEHYEQVSFVNGNETRNGGKHVDYILYQIINKIKGMLETKKKLKDVKPNFIKDKIFLFLRATVVNPSFNSQTKEQLTTPSKDFGVSVTVSDKFIEKIYKSPIVEDIVEFCKLKENSELAKKTDGTKKVKLYGIPKLEDALWAGTSKSEQCTLILTEGLSAMTFALWGRSVLGPDKIGTYPLKGKVINIRDATSSQLLNNEELNNIKQILGLKQNVEYKDTKSLRYGRVMCLTDADVDGSHIRGLFINFIHATYPSLIKLNFIQTMKTPIVKAIKGKQVIEFFNEQDYRAWKDSVPNIKSYHIKYFKGLGTSKKEDAQDLFKRLGNLQVDYYYKDKKCDDAILLAFEKDKNLKDQEVSCTDQRKEWLSHYDKNSYIDLKETKTSYQDFIHKELIHFSIYDNLRSIPSVCDGLKPSQRKILYYMLKNNVSNDIKVAQLSGYISAEMSYHHGEASLQGAIVNMAQDFVGSNNINMLIPEGNHGCLDPNTEIILWEGHVKKASEIKIGDNLIGDDGTMRTVLQTTHGKDMMYKIIANNKHYIVNSQHILTLKFLKNEKRILWKDSNKSWNINYFDINLMKECYKQFRTKESSNIKITYNKIIMSKDEAFKQAKQFEQNINDIIDIKVEDFLKLPLNTRKKFYSVQNISCIDWKEQSIPIDPYIFGTWIGDGKSDGSGITSVDEEIIKEWVIYLDSIECELVHSPGNKNHDNYSYTIRKKGFGNRSSIGDIHHSSKSCTGCQSFKISKICDWHYNKNYVFLMENIKKISEILENDDKQYTLILKNGTKYNVDKKFKLQLRFQGHKKIYWKECDKSWNVDFFDGTNNKSKTLHVKNRNKNDVYCEMVDILEKLNISDNDIFFITIENYLKLPKYVQNKLTTDIKYNTIHNWKKILKEFNFLNNKRIPNEYIINSKENRLKLLAGIIDTDGSVKFQNGIPQIEIRQSKRLRHHIIKSIQFLCHSLGYQTYIYEIDRHKFTKKQESIIMSCILIYGNNLHEIPTKLLRKQIKPYKKSYSYACPLNIECVGFGEYCGWQLDGNERFLMNNFIITHNSRLNVGKDAASPRYIFTKLNTITTQIYNSLDNPLYSYLNDDGVEIEPEYMLPIIPMILVNGCEGIGTGYSTYIPQYNPKDIVQNLLNVLQDKPYVPLFPYFRNFNGDVVSNNDSNTQFMTMGKWKKISNTKIEITELPVGTGVIPYKEFLETYIESGSTKNQAKKKFYFKDVENKTKDENSQICFVVEFKNDKDLTRLIETNTLMKELKLTKTFTINNMYLFNPNLILTKYATPYDIFMEFYNIRLTFYEKRRLYMIEKIENELSILKSKIRFIDEYINNILDINKKSKVYTIELLEKRKYYKMNDSYDYLINMPIVSFTSDKITELTMQHDKKQKELNHYQTNTDKQLWIQDLTSLIKNI